MLKLTSVFLFVVMLITGTMHGQTLPNPPQPKESRADLRLVFSKETEKIKKESSVIDSKKMEKAQRQQTKGNKWTKKDTALMVAFAVGVTVLVILLVKYGKKCLRYSPPNCSFSEPDCFCEEYEEEPR